MDHADRLRRINAFEEQGHEFLPVLLTRHRVGPVQQPRHFGGHMAGEVEHDPIVDEFLAVNESFYPELETLTETRLVWHVQVKVDLVEGASPFAAGKMPRFAEILGEPGDHLQLRAGDDQVDVVAHRSTGSHPSGPPPDKHSIGNRLVNAVENRPTPLGELRRIELLARWCHREPTSAVGRGRNGPPANRED